MATFSHGILGGFSGKVGTVIGGSWRGKNTMRSIGKKIKRKPSVKQAEQRIKFALAQKFLTPFRNLVSMGFQDRLLKSRTGFNAATSYNLKFAVVGAHPTYSISYPKIRISNGNLTPLLTLSVKEVANNPNQLDLSWEHNMSNLLEKGTDKVFVLAYQEDGNKFLTQSGPTRSAKAMQLILPKNMLTKGIRVWVYVQDQQQKTTSISQFFEFAK